MAHTQKPDFVFPRNGRVHLNRWGCQFSRLLAAEVCASAWVMLDTPRLEVAWEYWLPTPFASFPFTSPPVRHRVPPSSERALQSVSCLKFSSLMIYIYICRTAPLTSRCFILYIYSTNTLTEYFKHAAHSPFFPLQNAVYFIMLPFLVPALLTF